MIKRLFALFILGFATGLTCLAGYSFWVEDEFLSVYLVALFLTLVSAAAILKLKTTGSYSPKHLIGAAALAILVLPFFLLLPLYMTGAAASCLDIYLDLLSCLTTTGNSFLSSVEQMPDSYLLLRGWLQLYGLILTICFFLALFSYIPGYRTGAQSQTVSFYRPKMTLSQILSLSLYGVSPFLVATVVCCFFLYISGLDLFWSGYYAILATTSGSDVPGSAGIGFLDSMAVKAILSCFMVFSALSVLLHLRYINQIRHSKSLTPLSYLHSKELPIFITLLLTVSMISVLYLVKEDSGTDQIPAVVFAIISFAANSGLNGQLPTILLEPYFILLFTWLAFIGGCSLSAAGGAKIGRLRRMVLSVIGEADRQLDPRGQAESVMLMHYQPLRSAWLVFSLYIATWIVVTVLLTICGLDFMPAFLTSIFSLTNTGGLHLLAIDVASFSPAAKILIGVTMFLGRLELAVLLTFLSRKTIAHIIDPVH